MNQPNPKAIRDVLDQLNQEYEGSFAGQSRATRDIAQIEAMVNRAKALLADAQSLAKQDASRHQALADEVKNTIELFEGEREQIAKIKSARPELLEFAQLGTAANLIFARYRRHFAGMPRATRDLGLLAELIRQLTGVRDAMKEIAPSLPASQTRGDLEVVEGNLKLYLGERGEIVDDRGRGTQEEQAGTLAEVANEQFRVYDRHFAGKSRTTRRPELMQRVIDNLTQIHERMELLRKQGHTTQQHVQNIAIVAENLGLYKGELEKIREARQSVKLKDLMGSLGGAANDVFEQYAKDFAGKDRRTREPDEISALCDELAEIAVQMETLGQFDTQEFNERNLRIVTERRVMYEREYDLIKQARSQSLS